MTASALEVRATPLVGGAATASQPGTAALHSCLYVGTVRHRRFDRVRHDFAVRLYFAYLDLDELGAAFAGRWWWSAKRLAPMWFRRRDYFGPPGVPLADAVRDAVAERLGVRPDGPVRVLTNLRCFGYVFNPVSIYYCFDRQDRLVAALAEITNTPWRQRHHYVVGATSGPATASPASAVSAGVSPRHLRASFRKQFHVSPFQAMEQSYEWLLAEPGESLCVHMQNRAEGRTVFDATLLVQRRAWTTGNLWRTLLVHPCMTAKVSLMIYWQAFLLWCKRAPFHVHPQQRANPQQRAKR